jgi:hypothetical protein
MPIAIGDNLLGIPHGRMDISVSGMMVPDYSRMESINRISTVDGQWTADRTGFVVLNINAISANPALRRWTINNITVGRNSAVQAVNVPYGSQVCLCAAVQKGDVIKAEVDPSLAGLQTTQIYCYYIPPVFVKECPVVVSDEQFHNFLAIPDWAGRDTANKFPANAAPGSSWTVERAGFVKLKLYNGTSSVIDPGMAITLNGAEAVSTAQSFSVDSTVIPVSAGDVLSVTGGPGGGTGRVIECFYIPPKFESVAAPSSSAYPFVDLVQDMYNLYVSPGGSNDNTGETAAVPLQTIEQALLKASRLAFPLRGIVQINLAAGEYTLPPDYNIPYIGRRVHLCGPGASPAQVIINVSGNQFGVRGIYVNVGLYALTVKGSVPAAGGQLVNLAGGVFDLQNVVFEGIDKTAAYVGLYCAVGIMRAYSCEFKNLPVAVMAHGGTISISTPSAGSTGNDVFYKSSNGGIISTPLTSSAQYTRYKIEETGGRVTGSNISIPAAANLDGLIDPGVYFSNLADTPGITGKPADFPAADYSFLLETSRPSDAALNRVQKLITNSGQITANADEWRRIGSVNISTGACVWRPWERMISSRDYDRIRPRTVRSAPWGGTKLWVPLGSVTTTTTSGDSKIFAIDWYGGCDSNQAMFASGSLQLRVRNGSTTAFAVGTVLSHFGAARANSVTFGYTSGNGTVPGATVTLYFVCMAYGQLSYTNMETVSGQGVLLTAEGSVTGLTAAPAGFIEIVPNAPVTT